MTTEHANLFSSWEEYYMAFVESCSTVFYMDKYPIYAKMYDTMGIDTDYHIINYLLNTGQNPQVGLDMLIQSLIDGCRYSDEIITSSNFPKIIQLFLDKGAIINIDIILKSQFTPPYIEEEIYSYNVRASLLNVFQLLFIPDLINILNNMIGWDSIEPAYYESMTIKINNVDEFNIARFKVLKHLYNNQINRYIIKK